MHSRKTNGLGALHNRTSRRRTFSTCLLIFSLAAFCNEATVVAPGAPQSRVIMSRTNSLPCPKGTVAQVAQALHFAGSQEFWEKGSDNDCQLGPMHLNQAIVALSYIHGEETTGTRQENFTGNPRDLDLVIWDLNNGRVLAHHHDDRVIQDDADHLESISIDIGAYSLAPGRRAFGIRTVNATQCTCDNSSNEVVTLYLQINNHLDRILSFTPHSWEEDPEASEAAGPSCSISVESSTSIALGSGSSHGLTDIILTTVSKPQYALKAASATCPALKSETKISTLHFDGKSYVEPANQGSGS